MEHLGDSNGESMLGERHAGVLSSSVIKARECDQATSDKKGGAEEATIDIVVVVLNESNRRTKTTQRKEKGKGKTQTCRKTLETRKHILNNKIFYRQSVITVA